MSQPNANKITAAYYFPNYHVDPRNEAVHGTGWTEWELVQRATPRFPEQRQPLVPLWGHENEAEPAVMERKIEAAAAHGVNAFLFDWYYYNDGSFLERCVKEAFMKASNVAKMRFALMWANHDWTDIHPAKRNTPPRLLYPGAVTPATFQRISDYLIREYFSHPSYLRVKGAPLFSIYDLETFVKSMGSVAAARKQLDGFRAAATRAGFTGLHLNAVAWSVGILEGERPVENLTDIIRDLGFDSATSYVWVHHVALQGSAPVHYNEVRERYFSYWEKMTSALDIPFFPNVTMGWDTTPRTESDGLQELGSYPFCNRIVGNTPGNFERAMNEAWRRVDHMKDFAMVTINAWNEWTEGSYLEPDTNTRMGYLEAIRRVVNTRMETAGEAKIR